MRLRKSFLNIRMNMCVCVLTFIATNLNIKRITEIINGKDSKY